MKLKPGSVQLPLEGYQSPVKLQYQLWLLGFQDKCVILKGIDVLYPAGKPVELVVGVDVPVGVVGSVGDGVLVEDGISDVVLVQVAFSGSVKFDGIV